MARDGLAFEDLLFIAGRVGVEVIAAPSSHRGSKGRMGTVVGLTRHHTGTPNSFRPDDDYPDYQVVKEGRPGLENSLSAFGIGRHRAIYVFSEFLSWHAGAWSYAGITDGNGHFLGIEAAGVGDWTDFQRQVYPRLCASVLLFIGEGLDMMPRHADGAMPRGRKSDAANVWDTFDDEVAHFMAHPEQISLDASEEFTVAQYDAIMAAINKVNEDGWKQHSDAQSVRAAYHAQVMARLATLSDDVDEKALADQIIAALAPQVLASVGAEAGLSEERIAELVEQRVRAIFADAAA